MNKKIVANNPVAKHNYTIEDTIEWLNNYLLNQFVTVKLI